MEEGRLMARRVRRYTALAAELHSKLKAQVQAHMYMEAGATATQLSAALTRLAAYDSRLQTLRGLHKNLAGVNAQIDRILG